MALGLGDILMSFGSGALQGARDVQVERQKKLDERIAKLQDAELERSKSAHKEAYKEWSGTKKKVQSIMSSGDPGLRKYQYARQIEGLDHKEALDYVNRRKDFDVSDEYLSSLVGEEPLGTYEEAEDMVSAYSGLTAESPLSGIVSALGGPKARTVDEQIADIRAQRRAAQPAPAPRAEAQVSVGSVMPEEAGGRLAQPIESGFDFTTPVEGKAPEVKEFFDPETGAPYKAQWNGSEWIKVGGTKRDADTAPKSFIYYDDKGNEARAIWTGNESDMAGGLTGFKQMGATKATSTESGAPIIKKIVDPASGQEVSAMYTGNDADVLFGQKGWVQFGGVKKDEGSVAREKWEQIQAPIYNAIKEGTPISPQDWAAFKLYTLSNRDAIGVEAIQQLQTLEKLVPEEIRIAGDNIIKEKTPATPKPKTLPMEQAVEMLRANPNLKNFFIQTYGEENLPADLKGTE